MNSIEVLELRIAKLLRVGVIISAILMLAGFILQFKLSGNALFNFTIYDEIPLADLLEFNFRKKNWGPIVSYSGLIVLISLPLIRVLLTIYLFIRQKEYPLAMIAFLVFTGLMISMSLGIGH